MTKTPRGLHELTLIGALWSGWGNVVTAVLRLGVLALLARLLSPADFGIAGAALIAIAFSEVLANLGLAPAVIQIRVLESRHITTAFTLSVVLGLVTGVLLFLLAPAVEALFRIEGVAPVLRVLAWVFPLRGLGAIAGALLRRDLDFRWLAKANILAYIFGYGLIGVVTAYMGWGVWAIVAGTLGHTVLMTIALLVKRPPRRGRPLNMAALRDLGSFATGATLGRIPQFIATQIDNVIIGRFLGADQLGLYGRAYQLVALPAQVLNMTVAQPIMSSMSRVQGQLDRVSSAYRRAIAGVTLVTLPAAAVIAVLAGEIVGVVLGDQWTGAVLPLRVLAIALFFRVTDGLNEATYKAIGAVYRGAWRAWLYAVLVGAGSALGRYWGLTGVAAGVTSAYLVNHLVMSRFCLVLAGIRWSSWLRAHLPALRWALLAGVVAWGASTQLALWGVDVLVRLVLTLIVVMSFSVLMLWRFTAVFVGEDGLWLLGLLRSVLPIPAKARNGFDTHLDQSEGQTTDPAVEADDEGPAHG